jgi:sugar phosphate isomerase/epimerase
MEPAAAEGEKMPAWRYAICNELFEGWALARVARFCRGLGYHGLELAPYTLAPRVSDLTPDDRAAIRSEIEREGLRVAGLHWLLARTQGLGLNAADADARKRTVAYLLAEIDLCADLGGDALVLGSPAQRSPASGVSPAQAWDYTAEAMRRCGERALERGVAFCIEALPPPECDFITTVDEAARLVREVDHPGFRMMVDVKAMSYAARPLGDQIRSVGELIRHVHVNDPNLLGPGMGTVAIAPVLGALQDIGYAAWVSVEAFDADYGIEAIARESIANLRRAEPNVAAAD